jgi:molybdopterin-guanine dinucleotide biosynthesis protein MobB
MRASGILEAPERYLREEKNNLPCISIMLGGGVTPTIIKVVSVVRKRGKTTLLECMVRELKMRGFRVATVKHAHAGIGILGDSGRFLVSGADVTVAVSGRTIMKCEVTRKELGLEDALKALPNDVDIILVEGFKECPLGEAVLIINDAGELQEYLSRYGMPACVICPPSVRESVKELLAVKGLLDIPVIAKSSLSECSDILALFLPQEAL